MADQKPHATGVQLLPCQQTQHSLLFDPAGMQFPPLPHVELYPAPSNPHPALARTPRTSATTPSLCHDLPPHPHPGLPLDPPIDCSSNPTTRPRALDMQSRQ